MSVSQEQKQEIIESIYKTSCCRRALLCGVLFAKGSAEGKRVVVTLEKEIYADFVGKLIHEFYGLDVEAYRTEAGGRNIKITFSSPSASKYISEIENGERTDVTKLITQKCSGCLPAFLRGVFLAAGRLSDPKVQFSLEFSLGSRTDYFTSILQTLDLNPLIGTKNKSPLIYFRKGEEIESFFGHAGLNKIVFDLIESKIKSLARRESQRYLNCVTSNYDRMAAVSERQIAVISKLDQLQLLSSLPDELQETARLKLKFPDLPLSALAAQMVPAISKSGLSHRLKKIEEVGTRLLSSREQE